MASSGSFGTGAYSSRYLTFNWWVNSQNISGNYTDIGWNLVGSGGGTSNWYKAGNFKVVIDGEQVYYLSTRINLYNGTVVASGTKRIYHNSDGSRSFGAWAEAGIYSTAVNVSGSGSWDLPQIPRQANITGANNFNDEGNPSFTFSRAGAGTLNVWLEPNPNGEHLAIRNGIPNTGSYTWNLTEDERNQLRAKCSGNSCTCRIGLYTIIGGTTYVSYVDKTMTIVNANPTFKAFTYKDTNTAVTKVTENDQVLVKGMSTLRATITSSNKMVALKKSTAKNYVATIDNINKTVGYSTNDLDIDLGTISNAGTKRLSIRAYDSRNNSNVVEKDITIYDYAKPVINASVTRLNNWENSTTLKVSGTYSTLNINNSNKNIVKTVQYRYRESNGTWSSWKTLTSTVNDGKFTCTDVILSLDNTKLFEFEIQAIDNLVTESLKLNLDVGEAVFFISSNKKACYINGQEILTYDVVDTW